MGKGFDYLLAVNPAWKCNSLITFIPQNKTRNCILQCPVGAAWLFAPFALNGRSQQEREHQVLMDFLNPPM